MQDEKSEDIEFIEDIVGQSINHVVRQSEDIKGSVNIMVRSDGKYDVTLHSGTDDEPVVIESLEKETLIERIKDNL